MIPTYPWYLNPHNLVETDTAYTADPGEWEKLDNVSSKSGAFPLLRRVEIRVNLCDYWRGDEFDDVVEELGAIKTHHFLPWLRDHDSLVFIFGVTVSG